MKDWLRRLQIRLWLNEVRRQAGGANNYVLDQLFSSEPGASSADRRKEFDFIEHKAKPPRPDVLHRAGVAAPGTRLMYEAPFWTLLRDNEAALAQCGDDVAVLLGRYRLIRVEWTEARRCMFDGHEVDERSVYNAGLKLTLSGFAWYDGLSLLLALYKEAKGSSNLAVADTLRSQMDRIIELAMPRYLPWAEATDAHLDLVGFCLKSGPAVDHFDASALLYGQVHSAQVILPAGFCEAKVPK